MDADEDAALGDRRGDELPEELQRREQRLATIEAAMGRLEVRTSRAEAKAERRRGVPQPKPNGKGWQGKKRRGKEPKPISETPEDKAQTNYTDPEAKIMPQSNKGSDCRGNAKLSGDVTCQIIVACFVTAAANDQQAANLSRRQPKPGASAHWAEIGPHQTPPGKRSRLFRRHPTAVTSGTTERG